MVKVLEDDEIDFLQAVDRQKVEAERKVKLEEANALEEFRSNVYPDMFFFVRGFFAVGHFSVGQFAVRKKMLVSVKLGWGKLGSVFFLR